MTNKKKVLTTRRSKKTLSIYCWPGRSRRLIPACVAPLAPGNPPILSHAPIEVIDTTKISSLLMTLLSRLYFSLFLVRFPPLRSFENFPRAIVNAINQREGLLFIMVVHNVDHTALSLVCLSLQLESIGILHGKSSFSQDPKKADDR